MFTYDFSKRNDTPMYEWLYKCMKNDILDGKIKAGEKLPSKRSLARHLEISVITIENAYAQLMVEGYVYGIEKKGYFVRKLEERITQAKEAPKDTGTEEKKKTYRYDLTANSTGVDHFPFSVWAKLLRKVLSEKKTEILMRSPYQGIVQLREAISEHLYHFRGMSVKPSQIVVGAGTEYLYGVLIQLLGRGKIYGIENPGYQKIRKIYEKNDVQCRHLSLDESGLSLAELEKSDVQIVHISPAHHFPTGIVMPIKRRQELLRWASQEENRYIIEDDYDSEFRFTGRPIPTMQSIDRQERVIYINTFSKTISPSIRISYLVLPKHLMERYNQELGFYSCTVPAFEQYILAEFMKNGYLEQHINRMRNYYRSQRDALIGVLETGSLADRIEITEEDAGLHFLVHIRTERSLEELKRRVEAQDIRLSWLDEYYYEPLEHPPTTAVFNYSGISGKDLPGALSALKSAIE